ncbi:hypothetical protein BCR42DRAFT_428808 [Absidia repens]|uniref:Uncharacterized protein n=1 Tax=Absidia repens TaxID=90262 RepID=A0A1X2HY45_9FUNG|nr:hypothetical protein BCR42DRAFT_428808 [Absidia repens]
MRKAQYVQCHVFFSLCFLAISLSLSLSQKKKKKKKRRRQSPFSFFSTQDNFFGVSYLIIYKQILCTRSSLLFLKDVIFPLVSQSGVVAVHNRCHSIKPCLCRRQQHIIIIILFLSLYN